MSDFLAEVRATLDTSGIPGEIESKINGLPVKFDNITIDAGKLRGQVESALKGTFNININPVINGGGSGSGGSFTKGMRAQMTKSISQSINAGVYDVFRNNHGFDPKTSQLFADNLTNAFNGATDVAVEKVRVRLGKNGELSKVVSQAVDETGKRITQTATKGKKGWTFSTDIAESFKTATSSVQKSSKDVAKSIRESIDVHSVDSELSKLAAKWKRYGQAGTDAANNFEELTKKGGLGELLKNHRSLTDDDLIKNYERYARLVKTINNDLDVSKNTGEFLTDYSKSHTLDSKMETWLKKNTKAAKEYGDEVRNLQQTLRKNGLTDAEFDITQKRWKEIDADAALKGLKGKTVWDQIKETGAKMVGLVSTAEIIDTAVRGFKEMYQAVYDIDTAMTNLKKVTNESESAYASFLDRSATSAQDLGRTVSSLVEQTASWSKLGYSLPEAEELSKLSSIYANVAEVSDETAVSDIVTALKAYGLETQEASRVVDSLNDLGNKFATDAASLGQGLSNSASALHLAGADLYESLAMITGITEITQDASGAGNALKISSMRLRGMKGALEELGEEVDPTLDSISKVQTQILNLTGGKVNIFDNAGEFRNYFDIMKEIAAVYKDLSSTDQATLSEILFGKNRGNQGAALIQAFQSGQIEKAYNTAINSMGSAAAEQEAWMQALEAKTQQFQAAWQGLSMEVLDSDFLKGAVDTGTGFLNVLTGIVDEIGVLGTVATGGGAVAFFKSLD